MKKKIKMDSKINQKSKKRFSCNACDKSYTQSHSLKSHIKIVHDGKKDFHCDTCGNTFGRKQALESHHALVHNVILEKVDKRFKQSRSLKSPIKNVHDDDGAKNHSSESMIQIRNSDSKSDSNSETDNAEHDVKIDHMEESENHTNSTERKSESDFEDSSSENENVAIKESQNSSEWKTIHELKVRYFQKNSSNHIFAFLVNLCWRVLILLL